MDNLVYRLVAGVLLAEDVCAKFAAGAAIMINSATAIEKKRGIFFIQPPCVLRFGKNPFGL